MDKTASKQNSNEMGHCPTCKSSRPTATSTFPFCSNRCRVIDLGNWLTEAYKIPAEPSHDSLVSNDSEET